MASIRQVYENVSKVNFATTITDTIVQEKNEFLDQQREQLMDGLDSEGNKISPSYASDSYAVLKNKMNPFAGLGNPDLYKTGSWQEGLQLNILSKKQYEFKSTDSKDSKLNAKYKKAKGLNSESIGEVVNKRGFRKALIANYGKATKLL